MSETRQLLVCTDLDRTLLPNGAAPESPGARERFAAFVAHPQVVLAYVTGRHRALIEEAIDTYALPRPSFVLSDVGTTIHAIEGRKWRILASWREELTRRWGAEARARTRELLAAEPALEPQEPERQARFKLSYYAPALSVAGPLLSALRSRLERAGMNLELVYSVDEAEQVGLLDVLPRGAGKKAAIVHLLETLGLACDQTLFAGDSGNDLDVLTSSIPAVLVANASDEIRELALRGARERGFSDRLFLARGGVLGLNGNYSAGILEGVYHYWPSRRAWLQ